MSPIREVPALRIIRAHLASAAEARRVGDLSAADAAETAALLAMRSALSAVARPHRQAVR
jgi:hypothetical protein